MRHLYTVSLLLMYGQAVFSQANTAVHQSLFYNINEVSSAVSESRLDSLLLVAGHDSASVTIKAYADFLGSSASNVILAKKRAEAVKSYLLKKNSSGHLQVASCKGFGEEDSKDDQSPGGEPAQRRVDVQLVKHPAKARLKAPASPAKKALQETAENKAPAVSIGIEQLEKGQSIALEGLFFIPGRHVWTRDSEGALANLLKTLEEHPGLKIEIQGHICCVEGVHDALDHDTNEKRLSTNRARAVYDYLVMSGIDGGRLTYKGYGHSQPKVQEFSSFQEQMNRRVEIKVLQTEP